jgi:hypothetical protein
VINGPGEEENMTALLYLFVAETLVFGLLWHNRSARYSREHEGEKPPATVLLPRLGSPSRQQHEDHV